MACIKVQIIADITKATNVHPLPNYGFNTVCKKPGVLRLKTMSTNVTDQAVLYPEAKQLAGQSYDQKLI